MDLAKIKPHSAKCVIRAPWKGNAPLGLAIWMQSLKCDDVQTLKERHAQERLALVKAGAELIPAEVKQRQGIECYAEAITKWEFSKGPDGSETTFEGKTPEYSFETAVDILSKSDVILDQLVNFSQIEEHFFANFAEGS